MPSSLVLGLNALVGALFLMTAFMFLATRQVAASLRMFVRQAILLSASALIQAYALHSPVLLFVAAMTIIAKVIVIPWVLHTTLAQALVSRREVELAVSVPASLIVALALSILAYLVAAPIVGRTPGFAPINVPLGLDALLISVYAIAVRREALPQFFGLLMLDNAAFFAGLVIASSSALVELVAALEGVILAVIVTLLCRMISERVGTTRIETLSGLREEGFR